MSISILNTDAGLSGKTIVDEESTQTLTGAKTFDRDPSAPFAVSSGSAVVANLDADKLDGFEGAAFLQLVGGTMTGDLKFTDALYDIGKSGATRPRDGFFSRNVVIGGTLGVTGISTFTGDVLTVAMTDYSGTSSITGWSGTPSPKILSYKKVGKLVFVTYDIEGTSNSATTSFTLPVAAAAAPASQYGNVGYAVNNGAEETGGYSVIAASASLVAFARTAGAAWTNTGGKRIAGQFWYEAVS